MQAEFTAEGNPYAVGVYGSGQLLTELQTAGLVTYFWQLMSTGYTGNHNPWPGRNMRQIREVMLAGIDVDLNEAPTGNPGTW